MPQYMMLIYGSAENRQTPQEMQAELPKWFAYTQALQDAGVMVAGDALQTIETATTVRVRDGETLITDGPFADTKESLGGYYIIDVPSIDEAIEWAVRSPAARFATIDVRPLADVPR